jgi:phage baseplate assembly protein gpV
MEISTADAEVLARQIADLYDKIADLRNKINGTVRFGAVTDVDAKRQMARVELSTAEKKKTQKSAWVPYGLGQAGEFKQIWHPSKGQNMTMLCVNGDPAQGVLFPLTYSKQYPTPSDDEACHILCDFGTSRIEVWKDKIKVISDNLIFTANKTILSEADVEHTISCPKVMSKKRNGKMHIFADDLLELVMPVPIPPDKEKKPVEGVFSISTPGPSTEVCGLDMTKITGANLLTTVAANRTTSIGADDVLDIGGNRTVMIGGDAATTIGGNKTLLIGIDGLTTIGRRALTTAGLEIRRTAPKIVCEGETHIGGDGGPNVARIGDKVAVDTLTGLGNIITGAGNSFAV